jgi:mevalonate kinase
MGVRASAPGKIILMGEHSAVYHRPALVAAVDRRLEAHFEPTDRGLILELPLVGIQEHTTWEAVRRYARKIRHAWQHFQQSPTPEGFRALRGEDPAHLVKIALGEAVDFLAETEPETEPPPIHLRLTSDIPIGAGFGSSAATAVAVVAGYLALRDREISPEELHRLTLEVERRQHGAPSGIDNAAVIHGGLVWAWRDAEGRLRTKPLANRSPLLSHIRVFNSGEPEEATGAVVAAVRRRHDSDPPHYEALLDQMANTTILLRELLEGGTGELHHLRTLFRRFEGCLEELGVVPKPVQEILRQIEEHGGAAKISGAGALSGAGAGSLLVVHERPQEIEGWPFLATLQRLELGLGAVGVQVSTS